MVALDMRTVFISYLLATIICTVVMGALWNRNKSRTPGVAFWFADYVMQSTGFLLILLRGVVPDFISMLVSNLMLLTGTVLLYVGLQEFVGRRTRQWHNVAMLAVFVVAQTYLIGAQPSLAARNILIASCLIFITSQCAWLMIWGADRSQRAVTRPVGLIMAGFAALAAIRVIVDSSVPAPASLFDSPWTDASVILANQLLFIGLTFTLILLVNRRLLLSLEQEIHELEVAENALRESEEKFSIAFQTIPDAVVITVLESGELLEVNESFLRMFDMEKEAVLGMTTPEMGIWVDSDARQFFVDELSREGTVRGLELTMARRDGGGFDADLSAKVFELGGVACVLSVFRDITDAIHAKQELLGRTEDLVRSNRDLEQFAYVASHDLQEPLRMVINYTQLLKRRYEGRLDSDADDFIGFAVEGAHRMQTLITELLAYSRVGTKRTPLACVDLGHLIDDALAGLERATVESGAQVTHDVLPQALCDATQIGQVLQNLIGNALKFRAEAPPMVHIGATRVGDVWTISVSDNGIGIEPEYHEQVFQIYRRLQSRLEYPGNGMGLAICKRILERHGQCIWIESRRGEGTTFFFTLAACDE